MADFTKVEIENLIAHLQGTCQTLDEGIQTILGEDYESTDLSNENEEQIDQEIFLCDNCGWWYEIVEQNENGECEDCAECAR